MKNKIKKILKSMVCAVFFMNSSVAFGSDYKDQSDFMYEALTATMEETSSRIKKEEDIVKNHKIVGAILMKEGKAVCQTTHLQGVTPSFMKNDESFSQTGEGTLPECNKEQRAELQTQAQYASLGSYGENKEAGFIFTFAAISCAIGALVGVTDDIVDDMVRDLVEESTQNKISRLHNAKKSSTVFLYDMKDILLLKDSSESLVNFQLSAMLGIDKLTSFTKR